MPRVYRLQLGPVLTQNRLQLTHLLVDGLTGRRKAGLMRNRAANAAAAAAAALPMVPGTSAMLETVVPPGEIPLVAPFMGAPTTLPPLKSGRGGRPNGKGYAAKGGRGGKAAASNDTNSNALTPSKDATTAGAGLL